jgi:hypothetical protein
MNRCLLSTSRIQWPQIKTSENGKNGSDFVPWKSGENKGVRRGVRGNTGSRQSGKWMQRTLDSPRERWVERGKHNAASLVTDAATPAQDG